MAVSSRRAVPWPVVATVPPQPATPDPCGFQTAVTETGSDRSGLGRVSTGLAVIWSLGPTQPPNWVALLPGRWAGPVTAGVVGWLEGPSWRPLGPGALTPRLAPAAGRLPVLVPFTPLGPAT